MTDKQLYTAVRNLGLTISKTCCSEFRINLKGGTEASAYYTDDKDDALATAVDMHARHVARNQFTVRS